MKKPYAVIQLQGKQHIVSEGDTIVVDRLNTEDKKIKVSEVLLFVDEKGEKIGQPILDKASVELEVKSNQKGEKIRVAKYKAKSRYRKVKGFRPSETTLGVLKISA